MRTYKIMEDKILKFAEYSNTCWWQYSKQCHRTNCKTCYLFLPLIKGMLDRPNFGTFEYDRMKECIEEAFVKKTVPVRKIRRSKKGYKLTKENREKFLGKVKEILKTLPTLKR